MPAEALASPGSGDHRYRVDTVESDHLTRGLVAGVLLLAGLDLKLPGQLPYAVLVVGMFTPMWWRRVLNFEFSRLLLGLTVVALIMGFSLASLATPERSVDRLIQQQSVFQLLGGVAVMLAVLWGRVHFPLHVVAVLYGAGDLADALLFSSRSWKYYLALPTTIIVVGWLGRYRSRFPSIVALVLLGVVTALDRGRSFFAFCVLAAAVATWQVLFVSATDRVRRWAPALVILLLGFSLYNLTIVLLTDGYLGEAAQQRTVEQIERSGSLLLGGRPTWSATYQLFQDHPMGYGLGVSPNTDDYAVVRSSFDSLNLVQNDGYIRGYVLGGTFRLHSISADMWARYGLAGLILAAAIAIAIGRSAITLIAHRCCPPLVALMTVIGLWYLAFEPTFSFTNDVFFAVGVALLPMTTHVPYGDAGQLRSSFGRTPRSNTADLPSART